MAEINFTTNMTEVEDGSGPSTINSCFGGADEIEIEELRRIRNVINRDRTKLISECARIQQLGEDEFDTDAPDFDLFRLRWLRNVAEYVKYARELYESGRISHETLVLVAGTLDVMAKTWAKTRYLTENNPYHAQPLPTRHDLLKANPKNGEPRNLNDFPIAAGSLAVIPPRKVPHSRTPSPKPPKNSLQVNEMALPPPPSSPALNDAMDPAVLRWVTDHAAATQATRSRMLPASRTSKELEEVRKERDVLREVVANSQEQLQRQLAEAEAKTKAAVAAAAANAATAANAALEREMENRAEKTRQKEERTKVANADAEQTVANAQAVEEEEEEDEEEEEEEEEREENLKEARARVQIKKSLVKNFDVTLSVRIGL